ncbi:hypothetical protein Acr_14g0006090 [Actinidia rufa]|uniref:Uncharacterized protein n=1 Tax=Actinidia rufa TaxID=165716 RepID=A0A7J0FQW0_9ERIC|nr:hypothetical protein Acr_14g0006090 [Actinidia rufa]
MATGDLAESLADFVAAIETKEATKEQGAESLVLQFSVTNMESMSANGGTSFVPFFSYANSKKRGRIAEIAHRIGYAHELSQQRRQVNAKLSQLPLNSNQRLRAAAMIVQDAQCIDLFFSLSQEKKVEWFFMLLSGYI